MGVVFVFLSLKDWLLLDDKNIMFLFVIGVEDDFFEYKFCEFFKEYGKIKSFVCLYMLYCVFINYEIRVVVEKVVVVC